MRMIIVPVHVAIMKIKTLEKSLGMYLVGTNNNNNYFIIS